jgi:hypothetical protein
MKRRHLKRNLGRKKPSLKTKPPRGGLGRQLMLTKRKSQEKPNLKRNPGPLQSAAGAAW